MDIVLVGDSGAMTVLGYPSTVPVTLDELLMLASAVRRGLSTPLLVGDLPFGSYEVSNEQAIANAQRFVKEAGCDAVKLERGGSSVERARAIVGGRHPGDGARRPDAPDRHGARRLPLAGPHRGARARGLHDALALQEAGCFSIVFEADPGRAHRADHAAHADPRDRHRRRRRDRRPGAGLPRPARHLRRARGALREALRRRPRRDDQGRERVRRGRARRGATPSPSTATRWRPDEIERLHELMREMRGEPFTGGLSL